MNRLMFLSRIEGLGELAMYWGLACRIVDRLVVYQLRLQTVSESSMLISKRHFFALRRRRLSSALLRNICHLRLRFLLYVWNIGVEVSHDVFRIEDGFAEQFAGDAWDAGFISGA